MVDQTNLLPPANVITPSETQQAVAALPTTTFDQQVSKLRAELTQVAEVKSAELAQQKEIAKLPITPNSFRSAYSTAAQAPNYESFKVAAATNAPELGPDRLRDIYAEVRNKQSDAIANQNKDAVFSAAELNDSTTKSIANAAMGGVGRALQVTGNLFNVGAEAAQMLRRAGISDDEYKTVKTVKQKEDVYQDSVAALRTEPDEAKKQILRDRIAKNAPENYTEAEQGIFKDSLIDMPTLTGEISQQKTPSVVTRLRQAAIGDRMKATINDYAGALSSVVNTGNLDTMMNSAWADYQHISPQFGTGAGNDIKAITDLAWEAGKTIINNPGALAQLVVQTIPDVVTAGRALPAALAANFNEKQTEARQIYKATYGEEATGTNLTKLNAGAVAATLLDTYGDKFVGHGGADLAKLASSVGLKTGSKVIDTTASVATKLTQATATGAAGEFIAEAGGNALTQLAGTQDISKVKGAEAYAEGVLGAGAGGAIATAAKSLSGASEVVADVGVKMASRVAAVESGNIKDLVSDIRTMDVSGATAAMKKIVTSDTHTPEQKAEAITDLEKAFEQKAFLEVIVGRAEIAQADGDTNPALQKTIDRGNKILDEMDRAAETLKVTKEGFRGTSVEQAYKTLTSEPTSKGQPVDVAASRQAAAVVSDEVNTPYSTISTDMAKEILDKRADVLTTDQVANLRSYVTTNEAIDTLTDSLSDAKVRSDIINGGNGNIGARTYVNAIISSIKSGDKEQAVTLASDLNKFAERHTAKAAAMAQIINSFDSGTPMPAAQQVALMAPFDSAVKKSQFKPFIHTVPRYARMIGEEAAMLNTVSSEMNSRVSTLDTQPQAPAAQSSATPVQGTGTIETPVNVNTEPARAQDNSTSAAVELSQPSGTPVTNEVIGAVPEVKSPNEVFAQRAVAESDSTIANNERGNLTETPAPTDIPAATRPQSGLEGQPNTDIGSKAVLGIPAPGDSQQPIDIEPQPHMLKDLIAPETNLVHQFVKVKEAKVIGSPLVHETNFIDDMRTNGISFEAVRKYLPESVKSMTDSQVQLMNNFLNFNKGFRESVSEVLGATDSTYAFTDAINYLRDSAGQLKTSVIDAMSVSAFNWLIVNANDTLTKDNQSLSAILNVTQKDHVFSNYTWNTVGQSGLPYTNAANGIGREIINSLGLKLDSQDAPHTLLARMATSLGGRTLQTLAQIDVNGQPIVKFVNVSANEREIAHLIENEHMSESAAKSLLASKPADRVYRQPLRTVQVNFQLDKFGRKVPINYLQDSVLTPARDSGSFFNTLFSALEAPAMPTFSPVSAKESSSTMKRTDRKVTEFAQSVIDKFNSTKTYIKPAVAAVFTHFSTDEMAEMFGFNSDIENTVHKDEIESERSKNNLIKRNIEKFNEFVSMYNQETGAADFSVPFYLNMETTRVNRAQVTQSHMNMQSDKTARHTAFQEDWKVDINFSDKNSVDKFMLGVGQALGISVDKLYNSDSLLKTKDILNKPEIADGVLAGVALLNNQATAEQMLDIKNAVISAGKSAAALDGILAYAGYVDAFNKGQSSFTSTIGIEYDGVTNGPMNALIQFASANADWANNLKAGGIYFNSALENVVDAKAQGNRDIYEKVTVIMNHLLDNATSIVSSTKRNAYSFKLDGKFKSALTTIFGVLTEINPATGEQVVTPAGRNIAKSVVTPKTYQSSDSKTQLKLGEEAISAIRKTLTELSRISSDASISVDARLKINTRAKAIALALQELAPGIVKIPETNGVKDYLNATISEASTYNYDSVEGPSIVMTFPQMIAATYGAMFTNAVNHVNKSIEDSTKDTVQVSNMAVMLYEQARTNLLAGAVAAKAAAGEGKAHYEKELTVGEVRAIDKQLQSIFPEVMTALSNQEGTGVSLVESNGTGAATAYNTEMKLTDQTVGAYTIDGQKIAPTKSSTITTEAEAVNSPGVRGVVNMNLAVDGAIALRGSDKSSQLLSLYDAYMSGVLTANDNGQAWNRAMFKISRDHSIPVNTANMINKVFNGYMRMFGDTEFSPDILRKYSLYDQIEGGLTAENIGNFFARYTKAAHELQEAKRDALMNNAVTFNHYYSEGAAITFVNGQEININTEDLTNEFIGSIENSVDAINTAPNGDDITADEIASTIKGKNSTVEASADNDLEIVPELSAAFDKNNSLSIKDAINLLASLDKNSPTTNAVAAISQALLKNIASDTKVVRYDSRTQYEGDYAWMNTNQDIIQYANKSRGMFFPKEVTGTTPVIVLMAETMPYSGITRETLFHEVIHNLFDEKVYANAASPVGTELQSLVRTVKSKLQNVLDSDSEAAAFINSHGGINRFPGLSNMREFVAWGLSSAQFQSILKQISYVSVNELDNKLQIEPKSVLAKLRDLVQKVIFNRDIKSTTNEAIDNALSALITVSLAAQQSVKSSTLDSVSRQQGPMSTLHNISRMNSKELFTTLRNVGAVKASDAHETFLSNMMDTVVNAVLNPLNVNVTNTVTPETVNELTANDKLEIFIADDAGLQINNLPPQYGFNKSAQETYVHGLYQAILEESLQVGSPHLNAANELFNRASAALTYKDFMSDASNTDPIAIQEAKNRYASIFDVTASKISVLTDISSGLKHTQEKSDYLRNFLALAATNEQFRKALDKVTVPTKAEPTTLFERIVNLISQILDRISSHIVGLDSSLKTSVNIDRLTKRLVGAELRTKSQAETVLNSSIEYGSYAIGGAVNVFKQGLVKLGSLPAFKNNPIQAVRLASTFARITGNNKTEFLFSTVDDLFKRMNQGKQTFVGAIASEIKGTTKDNAKVHSLLRVANFVLDRSRKAVIDTMSKTLANQFLPTTKTEDTAITKSVLRTDISSLVKHGYTLVNMADLLDDANYLSQEITKFEDSISSLVPDVSNFYLNQAEDLGFTMARGFSSNAATIPNAYGIARMWETGHALPEQSVLNAVEPLIDALASLYAVKYTAVAGNYNNVAANVIRREYVRTDGDSTSQNNGMTFLLTAHTQLKDKALNENFGGNPALMRKGYMPDIGNPYIDIKVAPAADRDVMHEMGYKEAYDLEKDPYDPTPGSMAMYVGDGAGISTHMRGALSTTGTKSKGNPIKEFATTAVIRAQKEKAIQALFTKRVSPNDGRNQSFMQPVYNEDGQVASYRYIMAEATKDNLLSRDDSFANVMGKLAGGIYDKATTKPHNHNVIDALKEQYDLDVSNGRVGNYIRVDGRSADSELADLYNLMPYETKNYVRKVFGSDSVPIRAEFLPVIFGYRKISIADMWKDGGVNNNLFQQAVKSMFESLFGASGLKYASQFERGVQDVIRVAKTNVVVRMGSTTLSNLVSNTYDLIMQGIPLKEAIADQVTGYKKGVEYVRHASRIAEIDLLLKANHNPNQQRELMTERAQLKHLQAVNPVAELIEAGLLQTIALDVIQDIDPFSFSSKIASKVDTQLNKLPGKAKEAIKFTFMTRDSASFDFMNKIVQFSDFASRYAMYKHLINDKKHPTDKVSAINKVIEQFINYDLPTHRAIQYGNDMGVIWFTRYWLRIQKVIAKNFAEHPGHKLLGLSVQAALGIEIPNPTDSSILNTGLMHPVRGIGGIGSGLMANPIIPNL